MLIRGILEQQQIILTSAERLKSKYGLDLPDRDRLEDGKRSGADASRVEKVSDSDGKTKPSALDRALRMFRPELVGTTSSSSGIIAAANGPIRRLQWAAAGREKVVKVINDLGDLHNQLERLLDEGDRTWLKSSMNTLLRATLSHSTDLEEVDTIQTLLRPGPGVGDAAIVAAPSIKRIRLIMGVDHRSDETSPSRTLAIHNSMPRLKMLEEKSLKMQHEDDADVRGSLRVATYRRELVLTEWRETSATKYDVLEKQMQALTLLLGAVDGTFATLPCIGLAASKKNCRFALVYAVPVALADADAQHSLKLGRLYDLIATQRHILLRHRLDTACILAEAVQQLHTAGWLHKSVRSDNAIFLARGDGSGDDFLVSKLYLTGYDYARPVANTELTELPNAPLYTDLYRHPDKRGSVATGYSKRFESLHWDVFSPSWLCGSVLLVWCPG